MAWSTTAITSRVPGRQESDNAWTRSGNTHTTHTVSALFKLDVTDGGFVMRAVQLNDSLAAVYHVQLVEAKDAPIKQLRVVTYNVWFQPYHLKKRARLLINSLKSSAAQVICLQEGTQICTDPMETRSRYEYVHAYMLSCLRRI